MFVFPCFCFRSSVILSASAAPSSAAGGNGLIEVSSPRGRKIGPPPTAVGTGQVKRRPASSSYPAPSRRALRSRISEVPRRAFETLGLRDQLRNRFFRLSERAIQNGIGGNNR